jgi:vacuolar protein-sorting-associated protein 4
MGKLDNDEFDDCILTDTSETWSDIAGLDDAIQALKEAVILPFRYPHLFTKDRKPWRAILLYGPPGTGKTRLAKALATESKATFFSVSPSNLLSQWLGKSEKKMRKLFEKAQEKRPSVIFIDEVDCIATTRNDRESETARRIKTELLVLMQGLKAMKGVVVLAATNVPWDLDPAFLRRCERRIYAPLPDFNARMKLLKMSVANTPHSLTESDFEEMAYKTEFFSGSDLSDMIRNALMEPVRCLEKATHFKSVWSNFKEFYIPCDEYDEEAICCTLLDLDSDSIETPLVSKDDFFISLHNWTSSVCRQHVQRHEQFLREHGQN